MSAQYAHPQQAAALCERVRLSLLLEVCAVTAWAEQGSEAA